MPAANAVERRAMAAVFELKKPRAVRPTKVARRGEPAPMTSTKEAPNKRSKVTAGSSAGSNGRKSDVSKLGLAGQTSQKIDSFWSRKG